MLRLAIFFAASAGILGLSWRSLGHPRSHGFYRFFAFELLAALILRNVPVWFRDPLSLRQLVSWFLGASSIVLAIQGFRLLHRIGNPGMQATQAANLGFENTTTLVTSGVYRWIRHPLYSSLLALAGCAYIKNPLDSTSILLVLGACTLLIATALVEERENQLSFGASYIAYSQHTRRFIPFLF